jgi:hypothetical protein
MIDTSVADTLRLFTPAIPLTAVLTKAQIAISCNFAPLIKKDLSIPVQDS